MREEHKEITELYLENTKLKNECRRLRTELRELRNKVIKKNPNQLELFGDDAETYIYESPDGKTVYRRKFGDHSGNREKNEQMMKTLDLHGKRHYEVDRLVENFILLNEPPLSIITGKSEFMLARVENSCKKHKIKYEKFVPGKVTILKW